MINTCSVCGDSFETSSSAFACSECGGIVCKDCLNIYQGKCENCYFESKRGDFHG